MSSKASKRWRQVQVHLCLCPFYLEGLNKKQKDKNLEVQVHAVLKVRSGREALVLPHVVGHGEVPIGRFAFGQEDRVVEANVLVTGDSLSKIKTILFSLNQ